MAEDVLIDERDGRVAVLTLNRPDSLNALNTALMRRFADAVRAVAEDDAVGCVVVTGAGRGFCSGGDVKASSAAATAAVARTAGPRPPSSFETKVRWLRRSTEATQRLFEMPKPAIAMINGACAGAGLSIAAACDFRFAAASARFASAFTPNGMPGDYGGSWLWTHILGTARARQLYLLAERMDADAARAFGLIDRIHPDDMLRAETLAVAHRLAALPPTGLGYAKQNLNAALTESFAQALDREAVNMMLGRQALVEARRQQEARP